MEKILTDEPRHAVRLFRRLGAALIVCSAVPLLAATEMAIPLETLPHDQAEGIVYQRQQTMDQLDRDAELLGQIVAGTAPASKLAETTASIARGAHDAVEDFARAVPGGRTKADAWTNHADFSARLELFARNAQVMADAGKGGKVGPVAAVMVDAMPCKECHGHYREPRHQP